MLLYCRLKVYIVRMERIFCLTVSTNGELTRLCHKWKVFLPSLAQSWVCLTAIGGEFSSKMVMVFLFRSHDSFFFAKECVPSPANSIFVGF